MALPSGSLGVYEIITSIGEGRRDGQLYRARDTKLDRDVAIKVLPETFGQDTDRLARFQRGRGRAAEVARVDEVTR